MRGGGCAVRRRFQERIRSPDAAQAKPTCAGASGVSAVPAKVSAVLCQDTSEIGLPAGPHR